MADEDFLTFLLEGSVRAMSESDFQGFGISEGAFVEKAKALMPEDFQPSANIDVLPVVFNLAVVNKFNKNDDGICTATAIDMVKRFSNKPINIEHKKQKIVGHIINASFSDKEPDVMENDPASFAGRTDPFFINAVGVIYRHVFPKLCQAIITASDPESKNYKSISSSWEVGFKEFVLAKGSSLLEKCEVISDAKIIAKEKKYLKGLKGKGVDEKGVKVSRLITGKTYPLGAALTYSPAADVEGVYVLDDSLTEETDARESKSSEDFLSKNSLIIKNIVKIEKLKSIFNMDEKQFQQFLLKLEQGIASVTTEESQAKSLGLIFKDALTEQGESWKSQVQAEKDAKEKLSKDLEDLKTSFSSTQKELDAIKEEMKIKASAEVFNSRMNYLEENFSFNDKELQFVTAEVKDLPAEDTIFETYKGKLSVLFSHKLKESIASAEKEIDARIEEEVAKRLNLSNAEDADAKCAEDKAKAEADAKCAADKAKAVAPCEDEEELDTEKAKAALPNNNQSSTTKPSLIDQLKEKFEVEITL